MSENIKLEEVLEEYAAATPNGNDLGELRRVTEKYPQYLEELADYAAARAVAKHAPEEELESAEETHFQSLGLSSLRKVLGERDASDAARVPLASLMELAKSKGLNRAKFAAALGLSVSLVQYLEKRRLEFASVPRNLIAKIAETLETAEEQISGYLNQPPDFAGAASYKTNTRAEQVGAKKFSEAVREDQQLSELEKIKLIEMK